MNKHIHKQTEEKDLPYNYLSLVVEKTGDNIDIRDRVTDHTSPVSY